MAISESLGTQREAVLPQGTVRYRESGSGEPILFVHGLIVNGDLWRKVVPQLSKRYRCIVPDWPLGSHGRAMKQDADLSPAGLADLINDFVRELDLRDVTVVSNDTGTALTQILATRHPDRIGRLVLTSGDAFRNFPPHAFKPLIPLAAVPGFITGLAATLRPRFAQKALYRPLTKKLNEPEIFESYARPATSDAGIRRDLTKVLRAIRTSYTREAADRLPGFHKPVLLVWAPDDMFFPESHAKKLADLLPDARVEMVKDSRAFISEDQPERLAALIGEFLERKPAKAATAGTAA
jgi:pimeloyl-ACP methyl ester carboxylesterase